MKRIIVFGALLLTALTAFAVELNVPAQYSTIQAAIDAAVDGDSVIVAPGIYKGIGNRDIDFKGKTITVKSQTGPENCIIDCNGLGRGFYFHGGGVGSVLDGFTITNGWADIFGAGIYIDYAHPTISNCIITDNHCTNYGGGISSNSSSSIILNCIVINNYAGGDGGGIYGYGSVKNSLIAANTSAHSGGGVYSKGVEMENCLIVANTAVGSGGGIYTSTGTGTSKLNNCNMVSNNAVFGGGVYAYRAILLTDTILWGNIDSSGSIQDAQIRGPSIVEVSYCCIQDDNPDDSNIPFDGANNFNIDDDPLFAREPSDGGDGWGIGENDDFGDFHLLGNSPCIDAGDRSYVEGLMLTDYYGKPRITGEKVDIGADEFPLGMVLVEFPIGGEVFAGGSTQNITWQRRFYTDPVDILFSKNAGADWTTIAAALNNQSTYLWHLPDVVDSNKCLIKIRPTVTDPNVICTFGTAFTIHPDNTGIAVDSKWPTLGGSITRSGQSSLPGSRFGCYSWIYQTAAPVSAGVTVGIDGRFHIATEAGVIHTLNSAGQLLWSFNVNSPIFCSPAVGIDGTIYAGCDNGKLYAVNKNGKLRWTFTTEDKIYSTPAVAPDGTVYLAGQDGSLYAVGLDGTCLWSFQTTGPIDSIADDGAIFASPAVADDGTIYVGCLYDANLYAIEPNGRLKWTYNFTSKGWLFASPVIADDGTIYQGLLYDPNFYAIDSNGTTKWVVNLIVYPYTDKYSGCWSEPAIGTDGTIYVSRDDPYLRAIDPNGTIKWATGLGLEGGFTLAVDSDGYIYAAADDGYLCVVSPQGELISTFKGQGFLSRPVIAENNTVIVSDSDNKVYALSGNNCGSSSMPLNFSADLNADHKVNFTDLAIFMKDWLDINYGLPEEAFIPADFDREHSVDVFDLNILTQQWLVGE